MPLYKGQGLTQTADNCFVHSVGSLPQYLVGVIHRQPTTNRANPPACLSNFDTAGTPFAFGHVMALELGGCDDVQNIVPQYGLWQGNGDWRAMETTLGAGAQEVMVVEVDYAAVADTYAAQKTRFSNGEKLFHWTNPEIPTRFRVWGVTAASVAAYLGADDAGKVGSIQALITGLHGVATLFDQTIGAMPAIDRSFWTAQMVRAHSRVAYQAYYLQARQTREDAEAALIPALAGLGPVRASRRLNIARLEAHPYARPLPPIPQSYAMWSLSMDGKNTVYTAIRANTNNASIGWTPAERLAFSVLDVATALT